MEMHRRRRTRWTAAGLSVALALGTLGAHAGIASAQPVDEVQITSCGQVIQANAVLARDLVCSSGDGVVIDADGVTVDLASHTIRSSTGDGSGIRVAGPLGSTVTVRGPGTIRGFTLGIDATIHDNELGSPSPYRHHVIINDLKLLANATGIAVRRDLTDVAGVTIRGTNGLGMPCGSPMCDGAGEVNVDASSVTSTGWAFSGGMDGRVEFTNSHVHGGRMFTSVNGAISVQDSTLQDVRLYCSESGIGIYGSRLVDTTVAPGTYCGLYIHDNTIRSTAGGTAIEVGFNGRTTTSISGNRFSGWDDALVLDRAALGLAINANRFEDNGTGIRMAACPTIPSYDRGAIRDNTLVRNRGDGMVLGCGRWALGGNRMIRNGGLGIDASGPSTEVEIVDEGGNVASGNAEPQCIGLVCSVR